MRLSFRNPFRNPLGLRRLGRRFRRRLTWRNVLKWSLWTAGAFVVLVALLFAWYARDLPTPGNITRRESAQATQIFDRNGNALYAVFGEEKRITIAADLIPEVIKQATISIEDKNFYRHHGLDFRGLIRGVILKPLTGQRAQGGSTITQQYVKNALLSPERTIDRKIKEVILAIELEFLYSKDEILALYLNEIPYGSNAYGIEAAAETFFDKKATELTLPEAALLAALPQRPTYYSPYGSHTDDLLARQDYVLQKMTELGYITEETRVVAAETKLTFVPRREQILAPHFVLYVRDLLVEKYGEQMVLEGGLRVTTTLDLTAQQAAESAVTTAAEKYLTKYSADNAALVAVDPKTGQILAMVGSVDYFDTARDGNFNVTTAARQPGSSFKPIVYATAFKGKWSPASTLYDLETDFGNYSPQNFDGSQRGPVSVRSALANSLNIPAVKMLALAGIDNVLETAADFGITTLTEPDRYGLSLVLGGAEVRPLELAAAYGVFAAGGVYHPTTGILRVEDSKGRVLDEWRDDPREVLAPEIAHQITSILNDNNARTPVFGARSPLYFPGLHVAAKTGTTQEYRDGWTVGYSPSIAAAVWVGNNDNSPMNKAGGVRAAGPIFNRFISSFYDNREADGFPQPATLVPYTIEPLSGKIPTEHSPSTRTDLFAPWQIPTERDDVHVVVRVNKLNDKLATDLTPPDLIEERLFTRVHSEQPQKPAWENPVLAWAHDQGYNLSDPPTDPDDTTAESLPTISITGPASGAAVSGTLTITASPAAPNGIRTVDFYLDNVGIATRTEAPWSTTYNAATLATGHHELLVEVTDNLGATARASAVIVVAADQTPPGAVTNASATASVGGTITLAWKNPSDADVTKVRVYRSTASGQLGVLVSEESVTPDSTSSKAISGHSVGTTYYFTLRPVDATGNENQTTSQVSATAL